MEEMNSEWKYQVSLLEQATKNWADTSKWISTVNTFPQLNCTLTKTAEEGLENLNDLNFFKQSIKPIWEDDVNKRGGRIIMEIPLSKKEMLNEVWKKTVVFCAVEPYDCINGCVYGEKANYRISLWIGDSNMADEITSL